MPTTRRKIGHRGTEPIRVRKRSEVGVGEFGPRVFAARFTNRWRFDLLDSRIPEDWPQRHGADPSSETIRGRSREFGPRVFAARFTNRWRFDLLNSEFWILGFWIPVIPVIPVSRS